MRKNKFSILLSIMSFYLVSCGPLKAQTSFHKIVKNVNEKFLQSASAALLKPAHASFGKSIFSDDCDFKHEPNAIINFHFRTPIIRSLNQVLHLSGSSFKNEKFVTTGLSLPGNVARWWRLQININYDWQLRKTNRNGPFRFFHISDYNINASQYFKMSKDFSLKLTARYSSIGFLPNY